VDRHVEAGNGDQTAIIWDSPVTKTKEKYTYKQLLNAVETFAGVLREEGVRKGDVVLIYSECYSRYYRLAANTLSACQRTCSK
jgi:propionyl-CoA synthetase